MRIAVERAVIVFVGVAMLCVSCTQPPGASSSSGGLSAEPVKVIENFDIPECVLLDVENDVAFVTNIVTSKEEYWGDDGTGFISRMSPDGTVDALRWLDSTPDAALNAPKGMCLLGEHLYFTDNARLLRCPRSGGAVEQIAVPGAKKLNDLATDGKAVWVSDTEGGKVYRVDVDGSVRTIKAPKGVNGVTFAGEKLFAVSWDLHEVYQLDPTGAGEPVAFGLASHFTNLDGIEVLDDGVFIVSDFMGNKVSTVSADRKTVTTLIEIESPADIGLDRKRGMLYIPMFMKARVAIYRLVTK